MFASSSTHHEFLSFIKPVYYLRPRSYSLSLSRPPFLIAYQGVLFRKVCESMSLVTMLHDGGGGGGDSRRWGEEEEDQPPVGL